MASAVNAISPENFHCGKADGFHLSEGGMTFLKRGERGSLPRGLRQCYDTKRKRRELGRTMSCCSMAGTGVGDESKRQEPDGQDMVVGSVRSSEEAGNDRGAKGRMAVRNVTGKQGSPRRGKK